MLYGTATNDFGSETATISWSFTPACVGSQITTNLDSRTLLYDIGTSLAFDISPSSFTYEYKDDWADKGYSDGCTISFRLEGDATAFTTLDGNTITIAGDDETTDPGRSYLQIVGFYSGSTYGETTPLASPTVSV